MGINKRKIIMNKKIKKILLFSNIILIIVIISYIILDYFAFNSFIVEDKTIEAGSSLSENVNDYLKNKVDNINDYILDLSKVDNKKVGKYKYTISYKKNKITGRITIVDTTPPIVNLRDLYIAKTDNFDINNLIGECNDYSLPCMTKFESYFDTDSFSNIGDYSINFTVEDSLGNKTDTKILNVHVLEEQELIKLSQEDLTVSYYSEEIDNFDDNYYIKYYKALPNNDNSDYPDISIEEINKFIQDNYNNYTLDKIDIIMAYNKYNYLVGYIVRLILNDENNNKKVIYCNNNQL